MRCSPYIYFTMGLLLDSRNVAPCLARKRVGDCINDLMMYRNSAYGVNLHAEQEIDPPFIVILGLVS